MIDQQETWKKLEGLSAEQITPYLKKVKQSGNEYNACCPAHDEKHPSFSIRNGSNGKLLFNCFAGCSQTDLAEAIASLLPGSIRTDFTPTPKPAKKPKQSEEEKLKKKRLRAKAAAQRAIKQLPPATPEDPYFKAKGVDIQGDLYYCETKAKIKEIIGYVPRDKKTGLEMTPPYSVVPITNSGELSGLQIIDVETIKTYTSGTTASGSYWLTESPPEAPEKPILIGEGIATVLSAIQATGHYGVACLTLGNFPKVLEELRQKHPRATIGILAEIDKKTGRIHDTQIKAANQFNAHLIIPSTTGSDLNDQHVERWLHTVRNSINAQLVSIKKYRPKGKKWWESFKEIDRLQAKINAANKSDNPAAWCYAICSRYLYRMGNDLMHPSAFIFNHFKLSEIERQELANYFEWKADERRYKSTKPYRLSRRNLFLPRNKSDQLNWAKAKQESSHAKVIAVRSEHGSGKTSKFAKSFIKGDGVRVVVHRSELGWSSSYALGIDYRKDKAWPTGSVATCHHSLLDPRFTQSEYKNPHTVIIDEINQLACDLALTNLIDEPTKRKNIFDELKRLCRGADKVVALDADLSDIGVLFLAELCGINPSDVFTVDSEPSKRPFNLKLHYATSPHDTGIDLNAVKEHIKKGEKCCIAMESKEHAETLRQDLERDGYTIKLVAANVTRATTTDELTERHLNGVDCVIFTSKMGTGVSVENRRFTKCFALFSGTALTAGDAVQMLRRFRAVNDFEVTVRVNHRVTESHRPHFTGHGLKKWQRGFAQLKAHEHAYFATAFTELLHQRRFMRDVSPIFIDRIDSAELRAEHTQHIISAGYITTPHKHILNDQHLWENEAYKVRQAFDNVTPKTVSQYLKNRPLAQRIINLKHDERWLIVRELINSLSKDRINKADCVPLIERIRENRDRLKIIGALPERWAARGVPYKSDLGAVATFARHYGFTAKIAGDWVELTCTWREVDHVPTKTDLKAEAIRLKATGLFSNREIADKLRKNEKTIRNWLKSECGKTPENVITTNTCNDEIREKSAPFEVIYSDLERLKDQPRPEKPAIVTLDTVTVHQIQAMPCLLLEINADQPQRDRMKPLGSVIAAMPKAVRWIE